MIIFRKPVHDKSGDPARTRRNQENAKENRRPQQDDRREITSTQVYSFVSKLRDREWEPYIEEKAQVRDANRGKSEKSKL